MPCGRVSFICRYVLKWRTGSFLCCPLYSLSWSLQFQCFGTKGLGSYRGLDRLLFEDSHVIRSSHLIQCCSIRSSNLTHVFVRSHWLPCTYWWQVSRSTGIGDHAWVRVWVSALHNCTQTQTHAWVLTQVKQVHHRWMQKLVLRPVACAQTTRPPARLL